MGRIAEALKKAEQERQARLADVVVDSAGGSTQPAQKPATTWPDDAREAGEPLPLREGMNEALVAYYDCSSLVSEQYRSLRTRLLSLNQYNEHAVLAVTSSVPAEGKTITAVNLAFTLGEIRHFNVLLVDADFRRSSLARVLNLPKSPGLAELLAGKANYTEVIQKTPVPNLHFIAAGNLNGRSAPELLGAVTARPVFRWFESQYNFTIVDTPPATTVTDAGVIGQHCSGVIMVIRMHRTPEPLTKRAVRLLQANNIPITGCVLVGRTERGAGYGYRYNYYRYYNYGADKTPR
ncbi:MAG: CpsD/CapB family tyrosine-protein kinase [Phycisphaerae bacterium]|nr:CpsD/CapB family tyrosine-protein kinase [Phycisphaerae bacterium]